MVSEGFHRGLKPCGFTGFSEGPESVCGFRGVSEWLKQSVVSEGFHWGLKSSLVSEGLEKLVSEGFQTFFFSEGFRGFGHQRARQCCIYVIFELFC